MSSILTNVSAMVALQTMKGINTSMGKVQNEISTGKTVATAKDNAAVWAISKVMESDVKGFKAISGSLSLGSQTVGVASEAAETITELLTEMKGKIVDAQEDNKDRAKIQTDVAKLREQIISVVKSAQYNGLNLVDNSATVDILSSLDRSSTGVATSSIQVVGQDLSVGAYAAKAVFTGSDGVSTDEDTAGFQLDKDSGSGTLVIAGAGAFIAGDSVSVTIGGKTATYTVTADDEVATTPDDMIAVGLKNAIDALGIAGLTVDYDSASVGELAFSTGAGADAAAADLTVSAQFKNAGAGGLGALASIDVSTEAGAAAALGNIEALIQTSVKAAAEFGSVQKQIDIQADFVGKLTDALSAGIGALVDADMEEASARLQALQVQQQLGIQALSIANQAPQNLLSLFR